MERTILDRSHIQELTKAKKPEKVRNLTELLNIFRDCTCVDGREDDPSLFSVPGGHFGLFAALLAWRRKFRPGSNTAKLQEIFFSLCGKSLCGHTDEKNTNNLQQPLAGCGHIARCLNNPSSYGLSDEDIITLKTLIKKNTNRNRRVKKYKGNHEEGAVIVVKDLIKIALPHRWKTQSNKYVSAFVYHEGITKAFFVHLAEKLHKDGLCKDVKTTASQLMTCFNKQLETTLGQLAMYNGKPLPKFII